MTYKDLDALLDRLGGKPTDMYLVPGQVIRKLSDLKICKIPDSGAAQILVDHIKEHLFDLDQP